MTPDLVRIATIAAGECVRQQVGVGELAQLLDAVTYALGMNEAGPPTEFRIMTVARFIEPIKANVYRHHPVTFANGGQAAHHDTIERAMTRMFSLLDADTDPDEFVKAFLDVHPFADGNGRTGWVLWNWLRGTLHHPDPLPDYYGGRS